MLDSFLSVKRPQGWKQRVRVQPGMFGAQEVRYLVEERERRGLTGVGLYALDSPIASRTSSLSGCVSILLAPGDVPLQCRRVLPDEPEGVDDLGVPAVEHATGGEDAVVAGQPFKQGHWYFGFHCRVSVLVASYVPDGCLLPVVKLCQDVLYGLAGLGGAGLQPHAVYLPPSEVALPGCHGSGAGHQPLVLFVHCGWFGNGPYPRGRGPWS